jgi:hypothetical protein
MEKRRLVLETQAQLDAQRAAYALKALGFAEREAVITRDDLELQDNFVRYGQFLQENDGKRQRARRRAKEEAGLAIRKEAEIETLSARLRRARLRDEHAKEEVKKNERYDAYLESVLEYTIADAEYVGSGFREIEDVLGRHATLAESHARLVAAHRAFSDGAETVRAETRAFADRKRDEALTLNNEIARLKKVLEQTTREKEETARSRDSSLRAAAGRKMEHGRVCMATENLFRRVRARSHVKYKDDDDPLERLRVIGEYMSDLDQIVKQRFKENPGLTD